MLNLSGWPKNPKDFVVSVERVYFLYNENKENKMAHVVQNTNLGSSGETHCTFDTEKTLCGIKLNEKWRVVGDTMTYKVSCKECKKQRAIYNSHH